jgi:hypothetical protein
MEHRLIPPIYNAARDEPMQGEKRQVLSAKTVIVGLKM